MTWQRVDLTPAQIDHLKTLVTGMVSTNESVLDQHGRDESAIRTSSSICSCYATQY
jgi:D-lactate dehydrogenase (cytochrome)